MHSLWQRLTLVDLSPIERWLGGSYFYRAIGSLKAWRAGSLLIRWGDELGALLVAAAIVLSPFVSTEITGTILIGVAALWLVLSLADDRLRGITPIHVTLFAFWAVSALSAVLSNHKQAAFEGLIKLSLYLFLFLMLARIFRSQRIRNWSIAIYLLVAAAVSAYGVNQSIYGAKQLATWVDADSTLANTTRVYSYLNNPNLLAGYLLPAIAFSVVAVFMWQSRFHKALALVMTVISLYCLQATYCRGAWIGLGVMLVVTILLLYYWFCPRLPQFWQRWTLPIALGSIFGGLGLAFIVSPLMRDRVLSIFAARGDSSNNFRINVWIAVKQMIQDRPLLGIGPGDRVFKKVYPIYQVNPKFSALGAYSVFIETIVETGFIGFTCFIWSIVVMFDVACRQLTRLRKLNDPQAYWLMGAIVALVGTVCQGFVDTVWYRPEIQMLWWFCAAIIAGFYLSRSDDEKMDVSESIVDK
jgi:putative inorganic carbon (hco3(-)) transporter